MIKKGNLEGNHSRYYYQIPINTVLLIISIFFTLAVERYDAHIGGGIERPLLFLLINIEIFIAILLAESIIRQSVVLFLERRQDRPGSVLKKNLLFSFIFLSIVPGIFIFLGASKLVVKHLDLWFGARIEQGLSSGLIIYKESTAQMRDKLTQTGKRISQEFEQHNRLPLIKEGFDVYWWDKNNNSFNLSQEVAQWRSFRTLNDRPTKKLKTHFLSLVKEKAGSENVLLDFFGSTYWLKIYDKGILAVVHRPCPAIRNALIKVQNARIDYMDVRELKHVLKFNFYLQAILLLFLVLIIAIWCSFYLARGISEPIQQLLEATNAVRTGNLETQVHINGSRDLQALAISFNEMTKALAKSTAELAEKNNELLSHIVKINTFKTWQEAVKQIAHEIKNPLTPIQLTTQRLQRKCLTDLPSSVSPVFHDGCTMVLNQVEVIKNLVADFSAFAVPSKLVRKQCSIKSIIEDVIKIYHLSYPAIALDYEEKNSPIQSGDQLLLDAEKIKRVFVNLITNSIEAFKKGHTNNPMITITLEYTATLVHVVVKDNGPGIAPEIIDKLFVPYISTGKKNMGLGLAIVQDIITHHGGSIHTTPGAQGAFFVIDLPFTS